MFGLSAKKQVSEQRFSLKGTVERIGVANVGVAEILHYVMILKGDCSVHKFKVGSWEVGERLALLRAEDDVEMEFLKRTPQEVPTLVSVASAALSIMKWP